MTIKDTSDSDTAVYEFRAEGAPKPATGFSVASNGYTINLGAAQVAYKHADSASLTSRVGSSFSITGPGDAMVGGAAPASDGERYKELSYLCFS